MAHIAEERIQSALKCIVKITEKGGYLKVEVKDDILKAVSEIRKCFEIVKNELESINNERKQPQIEAMNNDSGLMHKEEDGRPMEQLATPVDKVQEATSSGQHQYQPTPTSTGAENNKGDRGLMYKEEDYRPLEQLATTVDKVKEATSSAHHPHQQTPTSAGVEKNKDDNHRDANNQQLDTVDTHAGQTDEYLSLGAIGKSETIEGKETDEDDIKRITGKVDHIMDFLYNKLGKIIEEKIKGNQKKSEEIDNRRTVIKESHTVVTDDGRDSTIHRTQNHSTHMNRAEALIASNMEEETYNGEIQSNKEEDTWTQVVNRRKRPQTNKQMVGTKVNNDEDIQAAQKNAWLFIGRFKEGTTARNVIKYLEINGIQGRIECEELESRGRNRAFKLGIPYSYMEEAIKPGFWPQGIIIRRFRFRRTYRNEGAYEYEY